MSNFIHNKRGCEHCSKSAYGEIYIKNFLESQDIKFETQKSFEGLINPTTNRKLRVDFYLVDFDVVIEVDGVQHYKSIEHWGGEKSFKEQIYRDNIKNNFFGDKLIRINNKQLKNIKEICQQLQDLKQKKN